MATRARITESLARREFANLNDKQKLAYRKAIGAGRSTPTTQRFTDRLHAKGMRAAGSRSSGSYGG